MSTEYLNSVATKVAGLVKQHPYVALGASIYVAAITFSILKRGRRQRRSTKLAGPASKNLVFGLSVDILRSENSAAMFEDWAKTYGPIYEIPLSLGAHAIVLLDPTALASVLSKDTSVYHQPLNLRLFFEANFGKNLLVTDGEGHKRQRRALSSGFSIAAIRNLTPVFYQSVYTVKESWDAALQSCEGVATIDVQHWMNNMSLDSIGKGGFSHDFGATRGEDSPVANLFDAFGDLKPSFAQLVGFLLSSFFPPLAKLPTERRKLMLSLAGSFEEIAMVLLEKARQEKTTGINEGIEKSIIGALVRSETASSNIRMDLDEIKAQNMFMIAGYETTATALTWALIELSRNPEIQKKLRDEVSQFGDEDPTYEQLGSSLPYLDAVVCETLRLHPSLHEISRVVHEDDIITGSEPIRDAAGNTIDTVFVPKGTIIRIPINAVNRLESLWGEDSHKFDPDRWIEGKVSAEKAAKLQGYRHLLTFADGPRTCLGKLFALTEIKAVLFVLIRDYTFELPAGPKTKIDVHRGLLPRPKVSGEKRARVPLLVRKVN